MFRLKLQPVPHYKGMIPGSSFSVSFLAGKEIHASSPLRMVCVGRTDDLSLPPFSASFLSGKETRPSTPLRGAFISVGRTDELTGSSSLRLLPSIRPVRTEGHHAARSVVPGNDLKIAQHANRTRKQLGCGLAHVTVTPFFFRGQRSG